MSTRIKILYLGEEEMTNGGNAAEIVVSWDGVDMEGKVSPFQIHS